MSPGIAPNDRDSPIAVRLQQSRLMSPGIAVVCGLVAGFILAAAVLVAWDTLFPDPDDTTTAAAPDSLVDLFRMRSGSSREALLVPAGPDCRGEPHLATRLFPGEDPPRRFATLMLANVSDRDAWDVDLAGTALQGSPSPGGEWLRFDPLHEAIESARDLTAVERLRLRSLGAGVREARLEPGTFRQFLFALPAGRQLSDLSAVQWGVNALQRDRLDLERVHRFREDPGAAIIGR